MATSVRWAGAPPGDKKALAGEARAIPRSILLGSGVETNDTDPARITTPITPTSFASAQTGAHPECADVRVYRPAAGRVTITLPDYAGATRMLRSFARCVIWSPRRGTPYRQVSRVHLEAVAEGLLQRYGAISLVTEHFAQEICGSSCYSAKSAHWLCTCGGCVARNHGSGAPLLGWRLQNKPGDVIETDGLYLTRRRDLVYGGDPR